MNQLHEAESMFSKYVDKCLEEGPAAMGFLFTKVDRAVLDPVGKFSCFLVDCCLDCCLNESEKNVTFAENGILHSAVLKRILTIAQDFSYPLTAESQLRVVDYIFRSWNSSVEVVCHEAVDIFFMLLSNHCLVCSKCRVSFWSSSNDVGFLSDEAFIGFLVFIVGKVANGRTLWQGNCLKITLLVVQDRWDLHNNNILSCLSSQSVGASTAVKDRLLPNLAKSKFLKDNFLPQLLDYINPLFYKQLNLSMKLTSRRYQALVSCIDDPFELCQITALNILKKLPVDGSFNYSIYKNETIKMMNSIRSHNTLAAGYRMQFSVRRVHQGHVSSYLREFYKKQSESQLTVSSIDLDWWMLFIQERLVPLCFDIAEVVSPAVHSMSPEGYIPDDILKQIASSHGNTLQMEAEVSQLLLVCCWRAHKHVSTILGLLVTKLCPMGALTSKDVDGIGAYYWLQLTECKHCGAFESAVEGIHALNVLKALFSSAALAERVVPSLEWACRIAINGCSAPTWPERNAAAQLAAALRSRIFGVVHKTQRDLIVDQKNRKSAYEFFSRFPSLHGYLYKQLCTCKDEFSIYPVLIFLTHLFPSNADVTAVVEKGRNPKSVQNYPLAPFIPALLRVLLWCRAEKLRTLTAAAVVAVSRLKRPLAMAMLLRDLDDRQLFSDQALRLEFYRHAEISRANIKILDVIYLNKDLFRTADLMAIRECISFRLAEHWRMPNTISRARRVLAFISNEKTAADDELEWMKLCLSVEEEISKRIALHVGAHRTDERVIARMVAFLQDEDISIREEVSCDINFHSTIGFLDFITDCIKDQYSIESCSVLSTDYEPDAFFKGRSNEIRGSCKNSDLSREELYHEEHDGCDDGDQDCDGAAPRVGSFDPTHRPASSASS
ncbi:unnamed protein product [Angiostrongylus costaricensis]|uniref:DUF2428 domain-containing protein n=1 Tax=Angiostrongylus costaricensis TaxID=334426 RepID=A0A0R3PUG9_ANGCS|nr:unnamed protein product [Angiostrongylus costaricensis]